MTMECLNNKVVIITGASSGIGKSTAIEFAKKEAKVVLVARREEKLKELTDYISSFNKNCIFVKTDVTLEKDVVELFEKTIETFGCIDILVNNAGRGLNQQVDNISYEDWKAVMNTNLTSVFLCTREAVKKMKENKKGHIITVCSIAGLFGAPRYSAYCSSKHGVAGFVKSIKWELRRYGIKVSTIYPARVDTEFFDIYSQRPGRSQMLSSKDIADYLIAVANRSLPKIVGIRILNILKRLYYLLRYSFSK